MIAVRRIFVKHISAVPVLFLIELHIAMCLLQAKASKRMHMGRYADINILHQTIDEC